MQVTLTFPDKLMRKLRALHALTGNEIESFDDFLCAEIGATVDARIISALDMDPPEKAAVHIKPPVVPSFDDEYSVSSGLSSESINDEVSEPAARTRVSREMLEADALLADPEKEAVSPDNEEFSFADLIGSVEEPVEKTEATDLSSPEENPFKNIPVVEDDPPPRANVRKLPKSFRGKVTETVNASSASENSF